MVSSFANFDATRSRLLRFNAYLMQIILYAAACYVYFGTAYRANDVNRHEEVLDQTDISRVLYVSVAGSFFLLPWLSEPISHLLSNKLAVTLNEETNQKDVNIVTRRMFARYTFIVLVALMNVG